MPKCLNAALGDVVSTALELFSAWLLPPTKHGMGLRRPCFQPTSIRVLTQIITAGGGIVIPNPNSGPGLVDPELGKDLSRLD